jgi:hypothetical protein
LLAVRWTDRTKLIGLIGTFFLLLVANMPKSDCWIFVEGDQDEETFFYFSWNFDSLQGLSSWGSRLVLTYPYFILLLRPLGSSFYILTHSPPPYLSRLFGSSFSLTISNSADCNGYWKSESHWVETLCSPRHSTRSQTLMFHSSRLLHALHCPMLYCLKVKLSCNRKLLATALHK